MPLVHSLNDSVLVRIAAGVRGTEVTVVQCTPKLPVVAVGCVDKKARLSALVKLRSFANVCQLFEGAKSVSNALFCS